MTHFSTSILPLAALLHPFIHPIIYHYHHRHYHRRLRRRRYHHHRYGVLRRGIAVSSCTLCRNDSLPVVSAAPLAARTTFEVNSRLVPFCWLERPLGCGSTGPVRLVVVYWQLGVPAIRHFLVERGSQNFEEWRVLIGWAGEHGEGEGKGQRGFPKN